MTRRVGYITCMGEIKKGYKILLKNSRRRNW
jgi:hypothetical protein